VSKPIDRAFVIEAIDAHESTLLRYAGALVKDQAADVVQETFLSLCKQDRADVEPQLRAWLFRVCRNRALDLLRQAKRRTSGDDPDSLADASAGPARTVEARLGVHALSARIDALPERQREAVLLRLGADLSYDEVASVMETTSGNVGYLLNKALTKLRTEVPREATEPTPAFTAPADAESASEPPTQAR
jgi:RNA polymerase sigma-70 factor (ECF subfamily)